MTPTRSPAALSKARTHRLLLEDGAGEGELVDGRDDGLLEEVAQVVGDGRREGRVLARGIGVAQAQEHVVGLEFLGGTQGEVGGPVGEVGGEGKR